MNKCTMYLLVFMLITGSGLNKSARMQTLCKRMIDRYLACDLRKKQSVDKTTAQNSETRLAQ